MSSYRVRKASPVELEETTYPDCMSVISFSDSVARLSVNTRPICGFDLRE